MAGAEGPSPHLRATDTDREQAAEAVRAAAGDGRLGLDEAGDRLAAVAAAGTHGELTRLTADLGAAGDALGRAAVTGGWPGGVARLPGSPAARPRGGAASRVPEGIVLLVSTGVAAGAGVAGAGAWAAAPVVAGWAWSALRRR